MEGRGETDRAELHRKGQDCFGRKMDGSQTSFFLNELWLVVALAGCQISL